MNKHSLLKIFYATLLLTFTSPQEALAGNLPVVSDTTWEVYDASGHLLFDSMGNPALAQNVCLNATSPTNCPAGATQYGYPYTAWTTNLSSLPGATWIWAPGVSGATSPAAHAKFTFGKAFNLPALPPIGVPNIDFWIAADNTVEEILVNNNSVMIPPPPLNPTTNPPLLQVSIPASFIHSGSNVVKVTVSNADNPSDCAVADAYSCNPAGVVFGATIPFQGNASGDPGSCSGVHGGMFSVGGIETLDCPAQTHTCEVQPDGSVGWGATSGTCVAAVCTKGAKQFVACPAGLGGLAPQVCGDDGQWGSPNFSACACTGSDGMTPVLVGTTETVPCPFPTTQGSKSHTCLLNPAGWDHAPQGVCTLPKGTVGGLCGDGSQLTAICPAGTTCGPRTSTPSRPGWCGWLLAGFGVGEVLTGGLATPLGAGIPDACNPQAVTSADWFCDSP